MISTTSIHFRKCSTTLSSQDAPTIPTTQQLWDLMTPSTQQLAYTIASNSTHCTPSPPILQTQASFKEMHPRVAIGRAITLMESKHPAKKKQGDMLLTYLLSLNSSSTLSMSSSFINEDTATAQSFSTSTGSTTLRVGIAGPPGAGKSTLTEAFGMHLLQRNPDLKLAVVCIDPSSNVSGGSILGDKTRMTQLSRHDRALIRPSSTAGVLGGLAAYTDDVVRLLGCAGYPLVLVETVGLGQSEIEVTESVDVLVLAVPPSGGDELQGVKKGIVEMANILVVTKADGDLEPAANRTASDYSGALRVLQQISGNIGECDGDSKKLVWKPPVLLTSSVTRRGLEDLWDAILKYRIFLLESGKWDAKRHRQAKYWIWKQFTRMMQIQMQQDPQLAAMARQLESQLLNGFLTPRVAAQELLDGFFQHAKHESP
ncbi:arginine/ornithine transport system ATPase [Nitzschia inconspicua]|uniref:Arginine/ornithine transport system ATPase n=1 Tax=Nitzschia inconspicua TaxID=303405 RepID=A0A9K3LR57_9STRA|nr:arginine/ornithine transport system ATPase [Nitzschia inconspicua]